MKSTIVHLCFIVQLLPETPNAAFQYSPTSFFKQTITQNYEDKTERLNILGSENSLSFHRKTEVNTRTTHLSMWPLKSSPSKIKNNKMDDREIIIIDIGEKIGSGSYGTVHLCKLVDENNKERLMIAKRAWTEKELIGREKDNKNKKIGEKNESAYFKEKAKRCQYYLDVEKHCLDKLQNKNLSTEENEPKKSRNIQIPDLVGKYSDGDGNSWLVFTLIKKCGAEDDDNPGAAMTLSDAIKYDWADQHQRLGEIPNDISNHHLRKVQVELGMPENSTFEDILDTVFRSLLSALSGIHDCKIVHRDVKPANLLCDSRTSSLVLIDFGSAADIDPQPTSFATGVLASVGVGSGGRVGLDGNRVAVSPIYAAPEIFLQWERSPLNFDTFSCALIFCQLLFNLLDERAESAFRQQLEGAKFDLEAWLSQELSSTLRPSGLEDGLSYLGQRPGVFQLLREMFHPDPEKRISTKEALKQFDSILKKLEEGKFDTRADGAFFEEVMSSYELCDFPTYGMNSRDLSLASGESLATIPTILTEGSLITPRPLHYIATVNRKKPLGLILSEVDGIDDDDTLDPVAQAEWERGTEGAERGEVFIRSIVENGQADKIGIFEIGDRLRGVGDLPFVDGGFERVVELLSRQPRSANTVKLHLDRKSVSFNDSKPKSTPHLAKVVAQGAWSVKGRRQAQEDKFVLHEIIDRQGSIVLMAGIFDGHGGTAASKSVSQLLPSLFSEELASIDVKATSTELENALLSSWTTTCNTYQGGCDENGSCVADYDPVEGIIMAHVGSQDLIAGTTATAAILSADESGTEELIVMNCGDSRTLLFGFPINNEDGSKNDRLSVVHFCTRDHSPRDELEAARLQRGRDAGFDYSLPECSFSRWWLTIGDYQYAVSRSLEGSFASSKGIVFDADISKINLSDMLSERESGTLFIASDGIFEVMDNEEVGREVIQMRDAGFSPADVAKQICGLALDKGTSDNVSVVVVYLE